MRRRRTQAANILNSRRRGAVLVAAAICLLLASAVLASAIKLATTGGRQVRQEQLRAQADWLTAAGVERAAARLASDADYAGETWRIAAGDLDGAHAGEVVIEVEPAAGAEQQRAVTARASYPAGAAVSAQRTRRANVRAASE